MYAILLLFISTVTAFSKGCHPDRPPLVGGRVLPGWRLLTCETTILLIKQAASIFHFENILKGPFKFCRAKKKCDVNNREILFRDGLEDCLLTSSICLSCLYFLGLCRHKHLFGWCYSWVMNAVGLLHSTHPHIHSQSEQRGSSDLNILHTRECN